MSRLFRFPQSSPDWAPDQGQTIMGDEQKPLPLSLKLWVLVSDTVFLILGFLFFLSGWYLGTFD